MKDLFLYLFVFILSSFLASQYASYCNRKEHVGAFLRIAWIFAIVAPVLCLACLRYDVGTDYKNYIKMFDLYLSSGKETFLYYFYDSSIGSIVIMEVGKFIFGTAQGVLCIYSICTITLFVIDILYFKDRINIFVAMMMMYILYFPASLNVIRQVLAVAVVLFFIRFLERKKRLIFFLGIVLASLIHPTAIICLPLLLVYGYKNRFDGLISKVIKSTTIIFPILVIVFFTYGSSIPGIGYLFRNYQVAPNTNYIVDFCLRIIVYLPLIKYKAVDIKNDNRNEIYYYTMLLDFILIISSFLIEWGYRLTYYTAIAQIVLCGNRIQKCVSSRGKKSQMIIYLVLYIFIFAMLYILWERDNIIPYDSILNHNITLWRD